MESLIELIAANKGLSGVPEAPAQVNKPLRASAPIQLSTPESNGNGEISGTPPESSIALQEENFDPISLGLLDEAHAYRIIDNFKEFFVPSFPFVIVESNGPTVRQDRPFLFHAILAIASTESPSLQRELEDVLRRRLARVIEHGQKSLDIVQGLLVYLAWYHTFFTPMSQQLAVLIHLALGLVQELGLSSNKRDRPVRNPHPAIPRTCMTTPDMDAFAAKRAYLGTYYMVIM